MIDQDTLRFKEALERIANTPLILYGKNADQAPFYPDWTNIFQDMAKEALGVKE